MGRTLPGSSAFQTTANPCMGWTGKQFCTQASRLPSLVAGACADSGRGAVLDHRYWPCPSRLFVMFSDTGAPPRGSTFSFAASSWSAFSPYSRTLAFQSRCRAHHGNSLYSLAQLDARVWLRPGPALRHPLRPEWPRPSTPAWPRRPTPAWVCPLTPAWRQPPMRA